MQTYQLTFRAPLHIGERGVGLEESRTTVAADTLFSALCVMWRELYGKEALEDLLLQFTDSAQQPKPFHLTSAFPVAGAVRFFPRPCVAIPTKAPKALRRVQFVSENIFKQIVQGAAPEFSAGDCLNGGETWLDAGERRALQPWATSEGIVLWRKQVVPRVTLDRLTSASSIWRCGSVVFAESHTGETAGLWFAAQVRDDVKARFEAALRLLGDAGLGGERSAGYGLFSFKALSANALPSAAQTEHFITLSPCAPADGTETGALLQGAQVSYELLPRRGWVGSVEAGNLRRKQVWMLREGAVLRGAPRFAGRLALVTPELSTHPVWRYGWAFPVGVNLS